MDDFRDLPIDLVGLLALCGFLLVSVLLIVAGGSRLPARWWAGALASGLIVVGASIFIVMAVSALDSGDRSWTGVRWAAIGAAGALGFLAGTDVQALIGLVRRAPGGTATAVAGALLGPVLLVGGYLLLLRLQGTIV
jgi:hypothetical protein